MKRRHIVLLAVTLLLAAALAQDAPPTSIETRLGIVENRIGRLEADVSRLSEVPTALARIEEKLNALSEKNAGWTGNLNSIAVGVIMLVIGGAVGDLIGRKRNK